MSTDNFVREKKNLNCYAIFNLLYDSEMRQQIVALVWTEQRRNLNMDHNAIYADN